MTVKELMECLAQCNPNNEVNFEGDIIEYVIEHRDILEPSNSNVELG